MTVRVFILGVGLILYHVYAVGEGWAFLLQPWMLTKLLLVIKLP